MRRAIPVTFVATLVASGNSGLVTNSKSGLELAGRGPEEDWPYCPSCFPIPPQRSGYLALFVALGGTAYATRPLITGAGIQDGSLPDADIAAANKDGTAGTPSLRTLGTGAQQAMPGNAKIGTSQFSRTIPAVRATGVRQTIPTG